jgi:hypothetical protein
MQQALEPLLAELVLGPERSFSDRAALLAWLRERGVATEDAEALADVELPRLLVYRRLVRGTLRAALERAIPRALERLGEDFEPYFDRFLSAVGPRTHYLRDVTGELIDFIAESAREGLPAYWIDLARHEALHIEVAALPSMQVPSEPCALALDAGLQFSESVRLAHYDYAVHELPDALDDRSEPRRERTHILAYRDAEHDVRYLALSELAADVIQRLLAGKSLADSLREAAPALTEATLNATASLLADLSERGVIVAPRAIGSALAQSPARLDATDPGVPATERLDS